MGNETKAWMSDILTAIQEINQFVPDQKDFRKFQKDLKTKRAIERNIEIIGEAINRLIRVEPQILITNARKIVDTRNRIIHGYDSVSEDIIWAIVVRDLPLLEKEIKLLIKAE
jgi:uncharacterized protein with HEPN domain